MKKILIISFLSVFSITSNASEISTEFKLKMPKVGLNIENSNVDSGSVDLGGIGGGSQTPEPQLPESDFNFTNNDTVLVRFENKNTSININSQDISISEMKIFDSNNDLVEYEARINSDVLPRQDYWNDTSRDKTNINDGFESCSIETNETITTLNKFNGTQKYAFLNFYTNKNFDFKRIVFTFASNNYKVPSKITIYKAINGNINDLVLIKAVSSIPYQNCYVEVSI